MAGARSAALRVLWSDRPTRASGRVRAGPVGPCRRGHGEKERKAQRSPPLVPGHESFGQEADRPARTRAAAQPAEVPRQRPACGNLSHAMAIRVNDVLVRAIRGFDDGETAIDPLDPFNAREQRVSRRECHDALDEGAVARARSIVHARPRNRRGPGTGADPVVSRKTRRRAPQIAPAGARVMVSGRSCVARRHLHQQCVRRMEREARRNGPQGRRIGQPIRIRGLAVERGSFQAPARGQHAHRQQARTRVRRDRPTPKRAAGGIRNRPASASPDWPLHAGQTFRHQPGGLSSASATVSRRFRGSRRRRSRRCGH